MENNGVGVGEPPGIHCYLSTTSIFFFFYHATWFMGSYFHDQGSNSAHSNESASINHWATKEFPQYNHCYYFWRLFCLPTSSRPPTCQSTLVNQLGCHHLLEALFGFSPTSDQMPLLAPAFTFITTSVMAHYSTCSVFPAAFSAGSLRHKRLMSSFSRRASKESKSN